MAYAGVGIRAVAVIIDVVVFFVMSWIIALLTGGTTGSGFQLEGAPAFLSALIWLGYYIAMEVKLGGTVGKLALGLRVQKVDGSPMDWRTALIRNVLRIVDGLFVYLVGAILVWRSPTRQRLGDQVAGTVVVRSQGAG